MGIESARRGEGDLERGADGVSGQERPHPRDDEAFWPLNARLVIGASLLALYSCTSLPSRPPATEASYALWRERTAGLLAADDWSFNGRAAVSGPDISSHSLRLNWTQHGASYTIAFMSVLGSRVAELEGGPAGVTLRVPDQPPSHAASSEELLASAFGWSVPLEGLRYWVMGAARPFAAGPEDVSLDAGGRLLALEQDGWQLDIDQYMSADGLELPKRLTLSHPKARVRLVIDEWTIAHAPHAAGG